MVSLRPTLLAALLISTGGCIEAPTLKICADFPANTQGCPTRCDTYCELLAASCPDELPEGRCRAECLDQILDEGQLDDETGDSLECRIEHAQRAADDKRACEAAGFNGGSVCVDPVCTEYCDVLKRRCPDAFPAANFAEFCLDVCGFYPRGDAADGNNTLECRTKYAEVGDCDPAHTNGGGRCGEPCDVYCMLVSRNCEGDLAIYESDVQCREECKVFRANGTHRDWLPELESDTLQCRTYHVTLTALLDPAKHCPHGKLFNDAHCGAPCDTFCALAEQHCAAFDSAVCPRVCQLALDRDEALAIPGLDDAACDLFPSGP